MILDSSQSHFTSYLYDFIFMYFHLFIMGIWSLWVFGHYRYLVIRTCIYYTRSQIHIAFSAFVVSLLLAHYTEYKNQIFLLPDTHRVSNQWSFYPHLCSKNNLNRSCDLSWWKRKECSGDYQTKTRCVCISRNTVSSNPLTVPGKTSCVFPSRRYRRWDNPVPVEPNS